jgi:hypothetical protein
MVFARIESLQGVRPSRKILPITCQMLGGDISARGDSVAILGKQKAVPKGGFSIFCW